jgi:hypothetical protein
MGTCPTGEELERAIKSRTTDTLETMSLCSRVNEGVDWQLFLQKVRRACVVSEDKTAIWPTICGPEVLEMAEEIAEFWRENVRVRPYTCANGVVFAAMVTLVQSEKYVTVDALDKRYEIQAMLSEAVRESFLLDPSIWPLTVHDVYNVLNKVTVPYPFTEPRAEHGIAGRTGVAFVIPKCTAAVAKVVQQFFPGTTVYAGAAEHIPVTKDVMWQLWEEAGDQPSGVVLNHILPLVMEPFVVIITGSIVPTPEDLNRLHHLITAGRLGAVSGHLLDHGKRIVDFCHEIIAKHWKLSFTQKYRWSFLNLGGIGVSFGPGKVCSTLAPTFMARTDIFRYLGWFNPQLDGEWALLDFFLESSTDTSNQGYKRGDFSHR